MSVADWARRAGGGAPAPERSVSRWLAGLSGDRVQRAVEAARELPLSEGRRHHVQHPWPVGDKRAYKDKHSNAEIHAAIEVAPVEPVDLSRLVAIQRSVNPRTVEEYVRQGCYVPPGTRHPDHGGLIDHPVVIRQDGVDWIHDGHNRLTAAALLGAKRWPARHVDFDAPRGDQGG